MVVKSAAALARIVTALEPSGSCKLPVKASRSAIVGIAPGAIEREAVMRTQRFDRGAFGSVGIGVRRTHDDYAEIRILLAAGREHGGRKRRSFAASEREEDRHGARDVCFQSYVPFNRAWLVRTVRLRGLVVFASEVFFDCVLHELGFNRRFGLSFDSKPRFSILSIADILHAPSLQFAVSD